MLLKFVVLVAVFFLTAQGAEDMMKMKKMLHDQCIQESGATEEMIADANKGKFSESDVLKCYMKCILSSIGAVDDDGNFNADVLLTMVPPDMQKTASDMIKPCAQEKGANLCEMAFNLNKCFYKQNDKKYYLM